MLSWQTRPPAKVDLATLSAVPLRSWQCICCTHRGCALSCGHHCASAAAKRAWLVRIVLCFGTLTGLVEEAAVPGAHATKRWTKMRPFAARVVAVEALCTITDPADRNTVRVEIDLGDSGLTYTPGDALGIWPVNSPQARVAAKPCAAAVGRWRGRMRGPTQWLHASVAVHACVCTAQNRPA
jgi:hypothetical protein